MINIKQGKNNVVGSQKNKFPFFLKKKKKKFNLVLFLKDQE